MSRDVHIEGLHWSGVEPSAAPDELTGAVVRVLSADAEEGGYTARVELPAGFEGTVPVGRSHEFFVLEGGMTVHGSPVPAHQYAFVSRDSESRAISAAEPAVAIMIVGHAHEGTGDDLVVDPARIPWRASVHDGIEQSELGRVINVSKILRRDPVTPTATGLSAMYPTSEQDCAEWHLSADEGYMISGDMLVIGPGGAPLELAPGDYNWRPSDGRHLPKYSASGNLRLFRVVGGNGWEDKLYYDREPGWPEHRERYIAKHR